MSTPTPLAVIAELTHRCPLRCLYCSNPLQLQSAARELDTATWQQVFTQAAQLGAFHAHFTGGEPLVRPDLEQLISGARQDGLYTNLITSGVGLNERRIRNLIDCGLDHLQLSFQDCEPAPAASIAGVSVHDRKVAVARLLADAHIAFTVNLVVHRKNLDRLEQLIAFAESFAPQRIEIAHVQFYGWALVNRDLLLPTREQVEYSMKVIEETVKRLRGRITVEFTTPDYYARYPKACMGGWGERLMLVDPEGDVLPCHAAKIIPEMRFENVRTSSLRDIWQSSAAFQRFRGEAWMPELCRGCERRVLDHGGCRCQAFLLAGNAEATDPVCFKSPHHEIVTSALPDSRPLVQVQLASMDADHPTPPLPQYRVNPA